MQGRAFVPRVIHSCFGYDYEYAGCLCKSFGCDVECVVVVNTGVVVVVVVVVIVESEVGFGYFRTCF